MSPLHLAQTKRCAKALCALLLGGLTAACGGGGSVESASLMAVAPGAPSAQLVTTSSSTDSGMVLSPVPASDVQAASTEASLQADTASAITLPTSSIADTASQTPPTLASASLTASATFAAELAPWLGPVQAPADGLPTSLAASLVSSDVIAYISPAHLYPRRNIGLQCQGANATLVDIATLTQLVETTAGPLAQRFGVAGTAANPVFRLELNAADLLPTGTSPRCELMPYPMVGSSLPIGDVFWLSYSAWVDDWTGSTDEQSIAQMHIQDPRNIVLNPFVGLIVRGNELRVELRHNALETPSQSTTTMVSTTRLTLPTRRWFTTVIQGRIGSDPTQQPFFRMWIDDVEVVHYQGPWGYAVRPDAAAYAKVGLYHWLNGNPWDNSSPTRSMMLGSVLLARDSGQRYARGALSTAVARPSQ